MLSPPTNSIAPSSPVHGQGSPPSRESIGLIGVGLMGTALAERFLAGGFDVLGFDTVEARRTALIFRGGHFGADALEVVGACQRIVLSLPDSEVVKAVLGQIEARLRPGQIIVDTTTGCPEAAAAAAQFLAAREVTYVEAMVSGNSSQVGKSEVLVFTGGATEGAARCEDLFATFASGVVHTGPAGSATRMKLVSNLVLGLNRAVLAEGLAFAGKLGLNLAQTLAVLSASMGYSRVMDTKGAKMIQGDFEPQARLSQHLKDVRLILSAAAASGARLPLSEVHEQLLQQAEAAGLGALDNCAIIRVFDQHV